MIIDNLFTLQENTEHEPGSAYDRGGADAWYHRQPRPHKIVDGQEVPLTDPAEIAQYHQGFKDEDIYSRHAGKQYDVKEQGVEEGFKDVVAGGALALAAMGAGAQSMPNINVQQVELANKYYNGLVQRAKEDGRQLDTRTLNFLRAKAQDLAAQKLQQENPQAQKEFPALGREQRRARDADQFESTSAGVVEGSRIKTSSGMYRNLHTGVEYSKPTGQDGHDSYMTPAYMLDHYKKRLAQIAAGPHKRPREVAQLNAKIAKLEKQGVAEGRNTVIAYAKKVAKGVWRIVDLGHGDHGFEWLDRWDSPIGDAWRTYFANNLNDTMEFDDYLAQNVDPTVLAQYAADVKGWINDAKFDINESTQGVAEDSEHTPQVGNDVIIRKRGGMPGVIVADNNDGTYTVRDENEQDHHVTADQLIITSYSTTVPAHVGTWEEGVAEGSDTDNFTIDDIHELEKIKDLPTLKSMAKQLIKGKPVRRMKPEKITWFYNHIDELNSPLAVIKMMYDLLLAGEGHRVIGGRHSMTANSYQQRFGEQKKDLDESDENIVAVIDGVESDRNYNDRAHAHNSLAKLVSYRKAKVAELYVNGKKVEHFELGKKYLDFEPKSLSAARHHETNEALRSFDTVGDVSQPDQSFKGKQAQWATSPEQILKAQKFFEKTPFNFRIFVSNIKPQYRFIGPADNKTLQEFLGPETAAKVEAGARDAITIIFVGNNRNTAISPNHPLTPWIMAHRISHMMMSDRRMMGIFATAWQKASKYLFATANKILADCYSLQSPFQQDLIGRLTRKIDDLPKYTIEQYTELWNALGTMRSARRGESSIGEFRHELFAQYIQTGTIALNPLPQTLGGLTLKPGCPDYVTPLVQTMSKFFETQLSKCVGRIFMMTSVTDEVPLKSQQGINENMIENIHNVAFIGKFTKDGRNYSLWSKGNYWYELTTSTQDREGGFKHVAEWHDKSLEDIKTLLQQRGFEQKKDLDEGKWFRTTYGWAGGEKPGGGKYPHPELVAQRRRDKAAAKKKARDIARYGTGDTEVAPDQTVAKIVKTDPSVSEAGPFSYGAKKPRLGSVADLAAKKRKEQERGKLPIEPNDQQVGVAKIVKTDPSVSEARPTRHSMPWSVWNSKSAQDQEFLLKQHPNLVITDKPKPVKPQREKINYGEIANKIEQVVGDTFPDGDPLDWLIPYMRRRWGMEYNAMQHLDRAARKILGARNYYDYLETIWDQVADDELVANVRHENNPWRVSEGHDEVRYVLALNGKDAAHYASEREARDQAQQVLQRHPDTKVSIRKVQPGVVEGLRDPADNPCWKGYYPVGTKKKNGRTVPNCVPKK